MRKGQKVCNYILKQGVKNEDVHQFLFYMCDEEFDKILSVSPTSHPCIGCKRDVVGGLMCPDCVKEYKKTR